MIIEFHLTTIEALENDDHLGFCEHKQCEHLAHLFEDVNDGYAEVVDVFTFVERTRTGYQKRLEHNKERRARQKRLSQGDAEQAKALAVIRRGWDRLYGAEQA